MAIIQGNAKSADAGGFYPKEIGQSLRFNSAYLSRTPASAGNRKTWTFSAWVKRGNLGINNIITNDYTGGAEYSSIIIGTDDKLSIENRNSSDVYVIQLKTTQVFRDSSAWYHILIEVDTAQATSTNRVKLYVNGDQVSAFDTATYPSLNADTTFMKNKNTNIFKHGSSAIYGDGYLAEVHFTDGTAYDADAFGEFKNGVWVAKEFTGTYGTNGFYLDFADGGALGNDVSGNNNDWTATNLASTDVMLDSPTNNFATLNPIAPSVGSVGSEGNLRSSLPANNVPHFATQAVPSAGKWYFEVRLNSASVMSDYNQAFGIRSAHDETWFHVGIKSSNIVLNSKVNGTSYGDVSSGSAGAVGDIYGMAIDRDANTIVIYRNGTAIYSGNNMAQHLGEENQDLLPYVWRYTSYSANESINFGQDSSFAGLVTPSGYTDANGIGDFYYAPPTGYLALCTANLPEPVIGPNSASTSDEHFGTALWAGDNDEVVTHGQAFTPDFVWVKARNSATWWHVLSDRVRGFNNLLSTNSTAAENPASPAGWISSIDDTQYNLVGGSNGAPSDDGNFDRTGVTYVGWNWKANGSGVSNTDGSITSTVSANTDAGFSIVSWAGNGNVATIGHGLSSAPDMVILKSRSLSSEWFVYHSSLGGTKNVRLNQTDAVQTTDVVWNDADPTGSVFSTGSYYNVNASGNTFIAYCFHSVEGFSKFGSYTGNGSTDGPFVYTGFRPAFVISKRIDSASSWEMVDSGRSPFNKTNEFLFANNSDAGAAGYGYDLLSNGFKLRDFTAGMNVNGGSYIYMAFAENPFKYSNAR
jgi:hypothetical protein